MRVTFNKILGWASLVVIGIMVVLLVIPWFLNPEYLKTLALEQIQRTFGSYVSVGQTSFALFPQPHFFLSDIVVKERPDSHAVFRAQSMSLELGIGQLLLKRIVVRDLLVEHPEIELRRDSSGEWRFLGHSPDDSPFSSLTKFLVMKRFIISGGKIIVIDESPRETVRGFVIEDVNGLSETSREGATLLSSFDLSGKLRQAHTAAPFHLEGQLEAAFHTDGPSGDRLHDLFQQVTFSGQVRADQVEVNQIAEYLPNGDSLSKFPGTLNLKSQVKWVKNGPRSHLLLTNIGLASSFVMLDGTANIEALEDGHHMMGFSMRSSNVDLEMIRQYLPKAWLPEKVVPVWDMGRWGGNLEILEARVTGSTREDVGTSVAGTFRLDNGFVTIPDWPQTEQVRGTVVVEPDRVKFSDVRGIYDGIPVEMNEGVFLLKESGPWGDVEIQGPVPADKVLRVVTQLGTSSDFSLLETWKVEQGSGWLKLRFAGNLLDTPGLKFQYGEYQPQNLVIHIPGLPHSFTQGHGKITFSRESTILENLQGEMGAYPMSVNGMISYTGEARFEPLTVQVMIDGQDVLRASQTSPSMSGIQVRGALRTSLALTGPIRQPKIKGWVDGKEAFISIPSFLRKFAGQEGTLEFDGQFHTSGVFKFERVDLVMLPLRLRGQGAIRYHPQFVWEGRLDSGPLYLGLLPEGIRVFDDVIQSGILEIQLKGSGRGKDWSRWNTKGWVALTEGVVAMRGIRDPIANLFVRLKVDQDQLELKRMEFRVKDSEAVLTGFMKDWKTRPVVSLMMESPQFDIDLLIPKDERSAIRDGVEWLAAHGVLEGSLHVERPVYQNLSGKKLTAVVKIHDNLVSVDKIQAMIEEHGTLGGRFFIHLPEGKPAAMRASFQANDLPFDKVLKMMGDERRMITGSMNMRGMIQGHGRDPRGILPTLNGSVEFSLQEGYVRKGTILPRILAILNLPHVLRGKLDLEETGFPFAKVSSTVNVEEGKFTTKSFLLNSSIMKVSAAGIYDLPSDRLEGVAAVSPFGAYSDLIKNIPLFGRIFSGDRKGIATAMFSVDGPLGNPDVVYMPVESLKTGLTGLGEFAIDILKNTITLPYELLKDASETTPSLPQESEQLGSPVQP